METLSTIEMSEIEYHDFVESADHYGLYLKCSFCTLNVVFVL